VKEKGKRKKTCK